MSIDTVTYGISPRSGNQGTKSMDEKTESGTKSWPPDMSHKIVWLVSPPRSRSTAVLRSFQERGDFQIMHEPFQLAYNIIHAPVVEDWYRDTAAKTYKEGIERILDKSEHGNVFVKDMSFTLRDLLNDNSDILLNKNIHFVFLLRNPHHSMVSCYNRLPEMFEEIKNMAPDFFGYTAAEEVYRKVKDTSPNKPYIIESEDLCYNAAAVMNDLCHHLGIEFKPEALHWDDLDTNFDGVEEWNEIKPKETTYHWNGDAIRSRCFFGAKQYDLDSRMKPTFSEITNPEHREFVQLLYIIQKDAYNKVLHSDKTSKWESSCS